MTTECSSRDNSALTLSRPSSLSHAPSIKTNNSHSKSPSWEGWNSNTKKFGLELQAPYAQHLLEGTKSIETRGYPIPRGLLSRRIDIFESKKGVDGVSTIPDRVILKTRSSTNDDGRNLSSSSSSSSSSISRRGWCIFTHCFRYTTAEQFEADARKHLVDISSGYGWNEARPVYGWIVGSYGLHGNDYGTINSSKEVDCVDYIAERRMRSLFEIVKE